jgi:hypothetical protein
MRTFAQKPKATQRNTVAKSTIPGRAYIGQSREVNSILHLQRAIGNQAVLRLLEATSEDVKREDSSATATARFGHDSSLIPVCATTPIRIQPKLTVNVPGDIYEQEADRITEQVMRMPEPQLHRTCACGGGCPRCQNEQAPHKHLQRKRVQADNVGEMVVPPVVHAVLGSSGQPLAPTTRAFFEPRFGHDFSKVRVHADAQASEAAHAVRAKAFTVGQEVVFEQGQYDPETGRGQQLLAHELTHVVQQSGSRTLLQRAETDTVPGCAALTDSQSDVDAKVNASLAAARATAGTPPSGAAVVAGVENSLGRDVQTGRTAIEVWASTLPPTKASLPAQSATKYANVTYRLWSNPLFPILNPTMKINSICVGSDKLGHFFQQGATFRRTEGLSGTAAAEEESERSEGGGFGLQSTGVFSNADREANRQGGKFYKDLIAAPTMAFGIASYISSAWSEVDHPNFYEDSVGHQVWANVLTGSWAGHSRVSKPFAEEALSLSLIATTAGTVTGTFTLGVATGKIQNGVITYNTTKVRGTSIFGNTTATPISGIHIDFDWTLGSDSGKGFLDSGGERHLGGGWGRGTSNSDRGTWDIDRT